MPTGYTEPVAKGISFQDFMMRTSRAFGALISMRDEPMDAPIPVDVENYDGSFDGAAWHRKHLKNERRRLRRVQKMSDAEIMSRMVEESLRDIYRSHKQIAKARVLRRKYRKMIGKVERWVPPTPEHVEFKNFALQQLRESLDHDDMGDYYNKERLDRIRRLKTWDAGTWRYIALDRINRSIEYHAKEVVKNTERKFNRNGWVADLKASLGLDPTKAWQMSSLPTDKKGKK